mmetsp:Transcript_58281/g.132005  ORF Transcript_58281/g.132005 Transcript_58281/m.132005 type:complete len:305 (-) Transcript_58281:222-1136(-)
MTLGGMASLAASEGLPTRWNFLPVVVRLGSAWVDPHCGPAPQPPPWGSPQPSQGFAEAAAAAAVAFKRLGEDPSLIVSSTCRGFSQAAPFRGPALAAKSRRPVMVRLAASPLARLRPPHRPAPTASETPPAATPSGSAGAQRGTQRALPPFFAAAAPLSSRGPSPLSGASLSPPSSASSPAVPPSVPPSVLPRFEGGASAPFGASASAASSAVSSATSSSMHARVASAAFSAPMRPAKRDRQALEQNRPLPYGAWQFSHLERPGAALTGGGNSMSSRASTSPVRSHSPALDLTGATEPPPAGSG